MPGDGLVDASGDRVEVVGEQAGVHVERHGRGRVAEHLLDALDVGAGSHGEARSPVSQVVRPKTDQPDGGRGRIEHVPPEVWSCARGDRRAR